MPEMKNSIGRINSLFDIILKKISVDTEISNIKTELQIK